MGLIVGASATPPALAPHVNLKPLVAVLDPSPVVPRDVMELCRWMARYYFQPPGEVFQAALPSEIQGRPRTRFRLTEAGREKPSHSLLCHFFPSRELSFRRVLALLSPMKPGTVAAKLKQLEKEGLLERGYLWKERVSRDRKVKYVRLASEPPIPEEKRTDKLKALLSALREREAPVAVKDLRVAEPGSRYWLQKLERAGCLEIVEGEPRRESPCARTEPAPPPFAPTPDQLAVIREIEPFLSNPSFQPFAIHGVTGSGKTEVYLRLAQAALDAGRGALVLVPEIALSTQMEALFRRRFGDLLAVWHSGLTPSTRYVQWREALEGRKKVALGARSAVFMPVQAGIIIVDEEHDPSYKQEERLRYHARDAALVRGRLLGVPVVLASATPSLQTVHHCLRRRYRRLELPRRIHDRPPPLLEVVDMRREKKSHRILSRRLEEALLETFEEGRQSLVFLNRRGFANFLLCNVCGHVVQCRRCSVSMTYHQGVSRLKCHYCGYEHAPPERCPECRHQALVARGFGTERVQRELESLLPSARVARMDRDTVTHAGRLAALLDDVRHRNVDILLGTQMIAKGHDFPHMTLAGIVNADTALQTGDFRAGEATVQTLMQVAGRVGRGDTPGQAIFQTYNPSHYTIRAVLDMSYMRFCREELESRRRLQYPPFTRMAKVMVTSPDEDAAEGAAREMARRCRRMTAQASGGEEAVAVLGPAPPPVAKLKDRFRRYVYLKAWTSRALQAFVERMLETLDGSPLPSKVHIAVDRDPVSAY